MISTIYHSPLGDLVLKADARGLVSLRFADADGVGAAADGATSDGAEMGAAPASGGDGSHAGAAIPGSNAASGRLAGVAGSMVGAEPSDCAYESLAADAAALAVDGADCVMPGSDALSGGAGMAAADPADAAAASVLARAWAWLNAYFAGQAPCWLPPLHMEETALSHAVWAEALTIPAGGAVELATFARRVAVRPGALDDGVPLGAAAGSGAAAGVVGTDPGAAASVAGVAAGCEAALGDAFGRADGHACGCAVDGALVRAVSHALATCPVAVMVPCHRVAGAPVPQAMRLRAFERGSRRA